MDDKTLYILPKDKQQAIDRMAELEQAILDLGPEFHDALNQSSETWHDNAPFDVLRDRQSVLQAELQNLKAIVFNSAISLPKPTWDEVSIGAYVSVENTRTKKLSTYYIAGDWTLRSGTKERDAIVISTKAPLAQAVLGRRVGDEVKFKDELVITGIKYNDADFVK